MERRLAAILAADLVGYTRLMGEDEAGTLRRLTELREDVVKPLIAGKHGRIVKLMGDGLLVEFASAVDSVACAVAWQEEVARHQADPGLGKALQFRIGINLGDVIVEGDDIHGDGVNIAARLEGLAKPGEICVSADVYRHARGKIAVQFQDMGENKLKNVAEPIHVYKIAGGPAGESFHAAAFENAVGADFVLPDYPSVAVLPFTVMSTDPEQEFFADGVSEDIITALSKIGGLLVVARNSTFTYKGMSVDVKRVSREQGVRYVLEGSVRKALNRVRITAQLIDANTGMHLWAERYDRELEDIFAVQDEITREVVVALDVRLSAGEQARIWSSGTQNVEAWSCVRQAMDFTNTGTPESVREARKLCEKALQLDPEYAFGWVVLGWAHHHRVDVSVGQATQADHDVALDAAIECVNKALALDPLCADAYALAGFCNLSKHKHEAAIAMSDKAVELAPGNAEILGTAAMLQLKSGKAERALELIRKAMRLSPVYPVWFCSVLGNAYRFIGRSEPAVAAFRAATDRGSDFLALHVGLASILGELGRIAEAEQSAAKILSIDPAFSISKYVTGLSYGDPAVVERFQAGLQKTGLPN
jgi:adenylate cyclase